MSLAALATLLLTPPPLDERTEILYAVRVLTEGAAKGDYAAFSAMLEPGGSTVMADMRPDQPVIRVLSNTEVLATAKDAKPDPGRQSRFGIPTVLIRESIAQVWVPFETSVKGKLSHCGIDNFSLLKRDGQWMITNMSYTIEPPADCASLAMPELEE